MYGQIEIITQRSKIESVAERWDEQYPPGDRYCTVDKQSISKALHGMDLHKVSAQKVDATIGNTSWTRLVCGVCGECVTAIAQVGEAPDYESSTASLCLACLREAVRQLNRAIKAEAHPRIIDPEMAQGLRREPGTDPKSEFSESAQATEAQ